MELPILPNTFPMDVDYVDNIDYSIDCLYFNCRYYRNLMYFLRGNIGKFSWNIGTVDISSLLANTNITGENQVLWLPDDTELPIYIWFHTKDVGQTLLWYKHPDNRNGSRSFAQG